MCSCTSVIANNVTSYRYLETYTSLERDRNLGREVRGHPLHVYQLIKRLVLFWPRLAPALTIYASLGTLVVEVGAIIVAVLVVVVVV